MLTLETGDEPLSIIFLSCSAIGKWPSDQSGGAKYITKVGLRDSSCSRPA